MEKSQLYNNLTDLVPPTSLFTFVNFQIVGFLLKIFFNRKNEMITRKSFIAVKKKKKNLH